MKRQTKHIVFGLLFTVVVGAGLMIQAQQPYNVSDKEVKALIERIEKRSDSFRSSLDKALDHGVVDSAEREDFLNRHVADFETATDRLEDNFEAGRSTSSDAQEVLNRAAYIDSFMSSYDLRAQTENDWSLLRADLDTLASYYNVTPRWGDQAYTWKGRTTSRLTGTYRLDPSRSENVNVALNRATAGLSPYDSARVRAAWPHRLDSPEMLAIDQSGQRVAIASSLGQPVAMVADGQLLPDSTGRVSTQSTFQGDALFIRTYGERHRDYTVTFTPIDQGLRVTRYLNTGHPTQPLVINSVYTRTSDVAQLNLYDSANSLRRQVSYSGNFVVPNGASLVATLNEGLDTSQAREGDRFTMNVSSPSEYDGAVIEGFISDIGRAGTPTGRADLAFNFERIRLRDGRVYDFAAEIVNVRTTDGAEVPVSSGAWVDEKERQAQQALVRTSQSAAIGAVVGTVPVSGSGTGVNSIFTPAGGDLKLRSGTEFVLRAASPRTI